MQSRCGAMFYFHLRTENMFMISIQNKKKKNIEKGDKIRLINGAH